MKRTGTARVHARRWSRRITRGASGDARSQFALAFAILLSMPVSSVAQLRVDDMAKTADGFYRAYESFRPPDGIPDANVRMRFVPYVSPRLDALLMDAANTEARYEKETKGQFPPLIEGDPFTPNFDGATSYTVKACAPDSHGGHCEVALRFEAGNGKPKSWTDIVRLVETNAGWRVDDIAYGDAANPGTLSDTLKNAIEHGNNLAR